MNSSELNNRQSMKIDRREFVKQAGAIAALSLVTYGNKFEGEQKMFGLIGKMTAKSGKRDELAALILENVNEMPGCLSYIVSNDPTNADAIWITEYWDNKESHQNSLKLSGVKNSIAKAIPLIADFGDQTILEPIGGRGLVKKAIYLLFPRII